jgi:iron complex outermembrane receptor protein
LGSQDNLGSYAALDLQQTYDPGNGASTRRVTTGNPDLRWEELTTTGVGLDMTTANRRLSATIEYYHTVRKNMLFLDVTPGGFAAQGFWWINLPGQVTNKGWEFTVAYKLVDGKKFKWELIGNLTTQNNNVTGLPAPIFTGAVSGQGLTGAFAQVLQNDNPIYTWQMPVFQGFDGNGNARYANGSAAQNIGTAIPKWFGGLTSNFTYNRWNLSVFFSGMGGHYIYNNTANALFLKGSLRNARNVTRDVGFSPENPFNPGSVSTRFLEKGDFVRLANMNLSYAFDMKGKTFKTLSVFASGQNLALWTKYSGIDPEVNVDKSINGIPSRGFDYTQYPRPIIVTFGVNLGF